MSGSGGAAATAGIDYQQRIAAMVMLQMLTGIKNYSALQLGPELEIHSLGFETDHSIDDLVLTTSAGRVFIQAKRTIHLSSNKDSEFSSVIRQFVAQQATDEAPGDIYLLATSSRSSRKITEDLRRIAEARRLNASAAISNPSTRSEAEVLEKTLALAQAHHLEIANSTMASDSFERLLRKMRIALLDIEAGSSLEGAALTLLSGKSSVQPSTVWGALISFAVSLAKERLSIDMKGLEERMGFMFRPAPADPHAQPIRESALLFEFGGRLSMGRDVVLVESFLGDADYLVMELFRFNEDGSRRLRYIDGKIELANGMRLRVFHRSATYAGMQRYR